MSSIDAIVLFVDDDKGVKEDGIAIDKEDGEEEDNKESCGLNCLVFLVGDMATD